MKIFFSLLFVCIAQQTYCMENAENETSLHNSFRKAVELAYENRFSSPDCETIKELIRKGANPNWGIEDRGPVLSFAITHQKKDLFNFLLENNANINAQGKDMETPLHAFITSYAFYEKLEINIEDILKHGADTNARTKKGFTPLCLMLSGKSLTNINCINYIKSLVKHGAEINNNEKSGTKIPLAYAVGLPSPIEVIQTLCKLGASLNLDENENIFHFITVCALLRRNTNSIKYIEPIITHARFDDFGKGSKKTVPFALWVLNNWETNNGIKFPKEIKLRILSNLSLSDLYPYKKLCTELLQKNHNHILLPAVHEHVKNIKQILASPNKNNQTALQYALEGFDNNQKYINNIQPLLDETLVQKAYNDFLEHFPAIVNSQKEEDKKNLVRQMFDNCTELFLE